MSSSARIRAHLRNNVIGYLALFCALTMAPAYAASLAKNSVKSKQIKDGQVKTADIAASSVDGTKVADGTIDAADLAANSVDSSKVAANSLTGDDIAEASLDFASLQQRVLGACGAGFAIREVGQNGAVTCEPVGGGSPSGAAGGDLSGTYPNPQLASNSVSATEIQSFAVDTSELNTDSITNVKLTDDAINNAEIADFAVGPNELAGLSVGNGKLADNAVTQVKLADNAIGNAEMLDNAVGNAEMADNAVGNAEMADNAVGLTEMADNSVGANEIVTNGVTLNDMNDGSVTSAEVFDGSLTTTDISNVDNTFAVGGAALPANSCTQTDIDTNAGDIGNDIVILTPKFGAAPIGGVVTWPRVNPADATDVFEAVTCNFSGVASVLPDTIDFALLEQP